MANTLFLRLEGPLQSWGERARWGMRDTAPEPTKSGVVGLLACALGWDDDARISELSHRIHLGVRCDQPGIVIVDYHTVVGGVMSAEGKIKKNQNTKEPETVVSQRSYLCDASFLVAVQSDEAMIAELVEAVQLPRWTVFLGRKSCPPSTPIFAGTGEFDSLETALAHPSIVAFTQSIESKQPLRAVVECKRGEGVLRRDEVDLRSRRTFLPRYTKDVSLPVKDSRG